MMNYKDNIQFKQPLKYVRNVGRGKHIVLFYEEAEYARMLLFEFLNSGLIQKERCSYISEEGTESVKREMYDAGISTHEFLNNGRLLVHQIPNLADHPHIPPLELETFAVGITSRDKEDIYIVCRHNANHRELQLVVVCLS